jgi:hypothetical protein
LEGSFALELDRDTEDGLVQFFVDRVDGCSFFEQKLDRCHARAGHADYDDLFTG